MDTERNWSRRTAQSKPLICLLDTFVIVAMPVNMITFAAIDYVASGEYVKSGGKYKMLLFFHN